MRRTALAQFGGLLVLVLLVGSNLILPAGAHVTTDLSHLQGHLDPRYINVNEKAANADLLDGKDSTAFMTGPGRVVEKAIVLDPGTSDFSVLVVSQFFRLGYQCPATVANQGFFTFDNRTTATMNVFIDNGGSNPTYQSVPFQGTADTATAAAGEFLTYQVQSPTQGIATIEAMSVHRDSDCYLQVQAVISS